MQQRSLNLRRLSLVMFAAGRNHFIVQLPAIQEKLVDLLRTSNVSSAVHSEVCLRVHPASLVLADIVFLQVYLCLRVLLCRFSPQHIVNLWPILLSELVSLRRITARLSVIDLCVVRLQIRSFENAMDNVPEQNAGSLQLLLAACKLLDLMLVMQTEDFQM
jgi:hypothetical protein